MFVGVGSQGQGSGWKGRLTYFLLADTHAAGKGKSAKMLLRVQNVTNAGKMPDSEIVAGRQGRG